jgi:phosphoadenosine phosphosulfate reductase
VGLFGITEEEVYQQAISEPLEVKERKSIALLREFVSLDPLGIYAGFSGGKDSQVTARLLVKAGVKHELWYNNVTIDPPELVQFIKRHYPHAKWNNPKKHLLSRVVEKAPGLPTRRGRWCCQEYKEGGGDGRVRAFGVRAEESKRRKGLWSTTRIDRGTATLAPILYWTEEDVWDYIRAEGLEYCSLYDEGFKRLGCVGCPLNPGTRKKEFERWPKYEEMWRRAGLMWWKKYRILVKQDGSPYFAAKFKTFEDYWSWWMEEKNVNDTDEPDCQLWLW